MNSQTQTPTNSHAEQSKKYILWYGKINTKDEALKIIKETSNLFYLLAALQIGLGSFVFGLGAFIEGVIFGVCAFWLRRFNSRVGAVALLLLSVADLAIGIISEANGGAGGRSFIIAIVMIWISARAIQATFGLKKLQPSQA